MAERIPNTTEGFSLSLACHLRLRSGIGRFRLPTHLYNPFASFRSASLLFSLSPFSSASCCFLHGSAAYLQ